MTGASLRVPAAQAAGPAAVGPAPDWWRRPGLDVVDDRLTVADADLEALARTHGTPLFVYDLARVRETLAELRAALERAGLRRRVRFALKANREPEVLAAIRSLGRPGEPGAVGIDACSPGEVLHALAHGWEPDEISVTATNLSERDLDVILAHPVRLNLDAVSQIRRVGRRAPGRTIGIRVNPAAGAGYHAGLEYSSGDRPTKFGVTADRLDDAIGAARDAGLSIDTVHFHAGSGWLGDGLPRFEAALAGALRFVDRLEAAGSTIRELNVGGGLGRPARQDEVPIDLDAYAAAIARQVAGRDLVIAVEPGDFVLKDAAVMLAEIVTVERRSDVTFVGLDAGWNVDCSYFIYRFLKEVVPVRGPLRPRTQLVTIAGHINEAGDVFAEDYPFPIVVEGEFVALLNAGGYLQAMASTHCLRPTAPAVFLEGPATA
ncbi:MAG TPA: hypothetical protein VFK54_12495 [Candidatus Limnocylindrales bacterium]|nr:hypothetical protein [Candidatus Limnocylindrales bacterium]